MTDPQQSPHDRQQQDSHSGWTWLAEIRRSQGRKGEVLATVLTDFPEKFSERRHLWLVHPTQPDPAPRPVELARFWMHKGSVILHFAGTDSISDAEALRGLIVAIPRAERAALEADAWYIGDLIGCTVYEVGDGASARRIGVIEDVDRTAGPVALLVVRSVARDSAPGRPASDEELLIPLAKSYLRNVNLAARQIEMTLPEGLLDVNARSSAPRDAEADHG